MALVSGKQRKGTPKEIFADQDLFWRDQTSEEILDAARLIDDYVLYKKLDSKEVNVIAPRRAGKTWFCLWTAIECIEGLGQTVTIVVLYPRAKVELEELMSEVNSQKINDSIKVVSVKSYDDGNDVSQPHATKEEELEAVSSDVVIVDDYLFVAPSILQNFQGKSLTLKVGSPRT